MLKSRHRIGSRPPLASRLRGFGTTIFAEMSALAEQTGAINLGQGFPDTDGPVEVRDAAIAAIQTGHNQYPPGPGTEELRRAVAEHQRRFYDLEINPSDVLITAGATEAITAAMLALVEPGDEVVMFEPYYDSYAAAVAMAGGKRRVVTLRPPSYGFDPAALSDAINENTRLLLLNSPHNPTGKVFTKDELQYIADLAIRHDLIVVTDEVYEHLVYEGEHHPIATLPSMAERTLTISSGGKSFSLTGWKIGWMHGPQELLDAAKTAKQFLTYVNGAPFQPAMAVALRLPDAYFQGIAADLKSKRDLLCRGLTAAKFEVYKPAGTYFVTADIRPLGYEDGLEFCRQLPHRCGVVAVPNVVFYDNKDEGRHLIRFAFCKRREVIEAAAKRLA